MTAEQKKSSFVDAHCHIDLFPHPAQIIELAEAQQIYTIAVTNAPSVFEHTVRLTSGLKYAWPALGLHPELAHTHAHELDRFRSYLFQTRYVGEVGLDYVTSDKRIRLEQRRILETIAGWVHESGDKVLTLHSRRAVGDVLDVLKGIRARMILHWFSGTEKELNRAITEGYFFSVNTAMMHSERARGLVGRMPRDRILTETDGPFVRDGNTPATPATVMATVTQLAEHWQLPTADAQATILENFRTVLTGSLP